ncbi:MAG: class I SAM-dependent methyltransferase [Sorangiineae bacterium]|nr:class I SAM-dependent methyltransferase [Polyangiaceae bacterium]MEB2321807.1 class I SAM-dependent methyltransferase [Sorangiineae bacterium]
MSEHVIVGNVYDKYGTRNPLARLMMRGFLKSAARLYRKVGARSVLEVGAGEGRLANHLLASGPRPERFVATDLELGKIAAELDPLIELQVASIYELPFPARSFELVVCCEVLEHLEEPRRGLAELARVADRAVLVSTPREPLWRALNVARGKYLAELGNTPGHVQHFSARALSSLARERLMVTEVRHPLPWTMLLGAPRR